MIRAVFLGWMACVLWATGSSGPVAAQGFQALARLDMERSGVRDLRRGAELRLGLSQGVPFRVFTLDAPRRLVVDFREVIWDGMDAGAFVRAEAVDALRVGAFRPGWSRMVADLAGPLAVDQVEMTLDQEVGTAELVIALRAVEAADFAARAGAPDTPGWADPAAAQVPPARTRQSGTGRLKVVLDPGHGGIDPGAEHGHIVEKDLMLAMARAIAEALARSGRVDAVLTRDRDVFVPLETRVSLARQEGADLFLSLHADALSSGQATGATVHVLSQEASDAASAKLAERHNRSDILAGVDLEGQDDIVAGVLMDLARLETAPRSDRLAAALVTAIGQAGLPLNTRPRRAGGFSVLKAADIPSVLLEVGFLSSARDRGNLNDPGWRQRMARAVARAILAWALEDAAEAELVRQ